jgi:hypothetical protein
MGIKLEPPNMNLVTSPSNLFHVRGMGQAGCCLLEFKRSLDLVVVGFFQTGRRPFGFVLQDIGF